MQFIIVYGTMEDLGKVFLLSETGHLPLKENGWPLSILPKAALHVSVLLLGSVRQKLLCSSSPHTRLQIPKESSSKVKAWGLPPLPPHWFNVLRVVLNIQCWRPSFEARKQAGPLVLFRQNHFVWHCLITEDAEIAEEERETSAVNSIIHAFLIYDVFFLTSALMSELLLQIFCNREKNSFLTLSFCVSILLSSKRF